MLGCSQLKTWCFPFQFGELCKYDLSFVFAYMNTHISTDD